MFEIKYKQFVIIPKKPKMSPGKIASQTAHATFMALEEQWKLIREVAKKENCPIEVASNNYIKDWKNNGMCVIVLECSNEIKLRGIAEYLRQWKIPHHLYIDEGLTEVEMGTATALATGVLPEDKFWIFGTMRMYK